MKQKKETIKLIKSIDGKSNGETIVLPKGFSAKHDTERLGYTLYFGDYHVYIPYEESVLFVTENMKELMLTSGMTQKEIEDYLTNPDN